MLQKKNNLPTKHAFTLIELLIVISIIGILSGIVLVSSRGGVDKARKASAVTTVTSVMTELVTCADDGGEVKAGDIPAGGGGFVCCPNPPGACAAALTGHSVTWPNIASTGWDYKAGGTGGNLTNGNYTFTIRKGTEDVVCDMAASECH